MAQQLKFLPDPLGYKHIAPFQQIQTPVGIRDRCTLPGNYELDVLLGMNLNKISLLIKDII
ncbi:hypothetical protein T11_1748 [Trichinella zimbabwensis]|uniref:Uncharacterized protein n=1 Tax=Trichinella zimbabwensis TaxID=268475 RepID=A0A0V1GY71_9BILA|nr:hypothetical protein T11_1748 [Trichinella zimbabwensis]